MPAFNYKQIAKKKEDNLFSNPKISEKNKKALQRFLDRYDVSDARKGIFLTYISKLLEVADDIETDMRDQDKMNKIFRKFREENKMSNYGTIVNVSNALVRWLNKGLKPEGFIDIKGINKNKQKRDLKPEDMITWDEGKKLTEFTSSIQAKAMLLTQLDAGFRPSEFLDLNFGDCKIMKDLILVNVRDGKTGARNVFLHRSAPSLMRWLQNHPTKKASDPLWVLELSEANKNKATIRRCTYSAITKRFKTMFARAGIKKPFDLYNLRHSSCVLDKKDNLPLELASERHGHSTKFFIETYGRLSAEDVADRYRMHYGEVEEKKQLEKNVVCEKCDTINDSNAEFCKKCNAPLSLKVALEVEKEKEDRLEKLEKMMEIVTRASKLKINV